jgi:uncharacterized protein YegL
MNQSEMGIPVQPAAAATWMQLGVMVNDGSGSMTLKCAPDESLEGAAPAHTKAAAVDGALKKFIERMQRGRMAANFCLSFVSFNDNVTEQRAPEKLSDVSISCSYDPTLHGTGGTAIHSGLEAASAIVSQFLREGQASEVPVSAVVVLMSDGEERDDPVKTKAAAAKLREMSNTRLAACLFAGDEQSAEGEPLLEEIVSHPSLYTRVHNAEELRKFFTASLSTGLPGLPGPRE